VTGSAPARKAGKSRPWLGCVSLCPAVRAVRRWLLAGGRSSLLLTTSYYRRRRRPDFAMLRHP
jgi:hypothetical protein